MKIWNLIGCLCECESLCNANCLWAHLLACAMGMNQLGKGSIVRTILLLFCICPIICCTGVLQWLVQIPHTIDAASAAFDGDLESGFQKIIMPGSKEVVNKADGLIDKLFKC